MTLIARGLRRAVPWLLAACVVLIAVLAVRFVLPRFAAAAQVEAALKTLQLKRAAPGLWDWRADDAGQPRALEALRREEITAQYRAALQELGFATQSGDASGLKTYFQGAALTDARLVAKTRSVQADWGHALQLRFYAPDGATVAFTDSAWVAFSAQAETGIRRQSMDVVLRLDDGNWRVHHWRVISRAAPAFEPLRDPGLGARLAARRGVNYVGRKNPFNAFWDHFDATETRASLRTVLSLNLNTIRVFVPYPTPPSLETHLKTLLDQAQSAGLAVIVTLLDGYTHYALADLPGIHAAISRLLPLLNHTAVLAVDVKNEAERDAPVAGWNNIRAMLSFVAGWVRSKTAKPVTAGLSNPDAVLSAALDFVTVHHYGAVAGLKQRLEAAKGFGKPVLLEETGFHTQLSKLPDPHTEGDAARYIAGVLEVSRQARVGVLIWNLHDFAPNTTVPGGREVERHLGLLRVDGALKPSALVLDGSLPPPEGTLERFSKFVALKALWWLLIPIGLLIGWLLRISRLKLR
jgi:hypothetical protein